MEQGLIVVVVGMTTVFAFLVLLVVLMKVSAWFFRKFAHLFPEPEPPAPGDASDELSTIAIVIAAVRAHAR